MTVNAKQGQWIAQVMRDMRYQQYVAKNSMIVQTRGNNQRVIHLVKNLILSECSKHIDISYHYMCGLTEKKRISVEYIPTNDIIANGITKPLPMVSFEKFVKEISLGDRDKNDRR